MLSEGTCVGGRGCSRTRCLPPAHRWGHSQTGVYLIFPSPRGRTHCGVMWPLSGLLAHCHACGAASMGPGVLARVDPRCTGVGGVGLAHCASGGPLREGPCSTGREADPLEEWIHRSTALGVCAVQASLVTGTGSLWNFGWGMGKGDGACQGLFPPAKLSSVFRGSTPLPPGILSPSPLSESRGVDF